MKKAMHAAAAAAALAAIGAAGSASLAAQQRPGLRLVSPIGANPTQLLDGQGVVVHTWPGANSIISYILEDGSLLRGMIEPNNGFPGTTGRLQKLDIDGNVTWDLLVSSPSRLMHHDIHGLPNGNVLVMAADYLPASDGIDQGRDPSLLPAAEWLPESILEIQQTGPTTGQVVWEWHITDHLVQDFDSTKSNYGVVADHPELVDINFPPIALAFGDWNHCNGIDYDPVEDWIVISSREQSEVWLIDHSTTTAEAAGHTGGARGKGGDLLWRWGNPQVYDRGTNADRQLFRQHDPRFLSAGTPGQGQMTIFNNNAFANQSAVLEIDLPRDPQGMPFIEPISNAFGPLAPVWTFTEPGFFSGFVSSAERLPNGNTLICSGSQSRIFEIDPAGTTVWSYTHPAQSILFQAQSVQRRLWASTTEISVANGGIIDLTTIVDTEHTNEFYYLLGTLSGQSPGTLLPGGVVLPLNTDGLLLGMLQFANIGVFVDTFGQIDAQGKAKPSILIPPGLLIPALVGAELDFAHVLLDGTGIANEVSNVVTVKIVP
ncbi:MAG: aryl-sulfate sulfotransferase [Planctomycetota bacterium]